VSRVLIACEFSGIVRDAFRARGHDAWSCDLLPSEQPGLHIEGDVLRATRFWGPWDLMVAHPPCTHLTRAGDRWYANSPERERAARFVRALADSPIPRIAIENPRGALNRLWRRPDQVIQPWMFGHGETKATCLWLKNLPPLMATAVDTGREARVHFAAPGPNRWKERSRTLPGIAAAMADQWGAAMERAA
jgi:site-specific DNA-cytosine methylase